MYMYNRSIIPEVRPMGSAINQFSSPLNIDTVRDIYPTGIATHLIQLMPRRPRIKFMLHIPSPSSRTGIHLTGPFPGLLWTVVFPEDGKPVRRMMRLVMFRVFV